jgi:quercetin dioxygenase-like cupin family protein
MPNRSAHQTHPNLKRNIMKKSATVFGVAALLILAACLTIAHAQQSDKSKVIYASSEKATYKALPGGGGATGAVIWGDPDKGPNATFTKFNPGYDAGMHTHTNDVSALVIKGAYLYKDDAGEKRVGPGEYIHIPGGHKHWSGGDKTEGALFYTEVSGKFDLIPAK